MTQDCFLRKKVDLDAKSAIDALEKRGALTAKGASAVSKLFATIQKEQPLQSLLKEIEWQEHAAVDSLKDGDLLCFQSLLAVAQFHLMS